MSMSCSVCNLLVLDVPPSLITVVVIVCDFKYRRNFSDRSIVLQTGRTDPCEHAR